MRGGPGSEGRRVRSWFSFAFLCSVPGKLFRMLSLFSLLVARSFRSILVPRRSMSPSVHASWSL